MQSLHVAIFSPSYAESEWCLDELYLMLRTGAPIVPVFWEIRPSQLRMEDNNGVYARAFQKHNQVGKFDIQTLEKWRKALNEASLLEGFIYEGDQGEMLEKIATCVAKNIKTAKRKPKLLEGHLKRERFLTL
ncbi:hypothetical protein SUGI_0080500 [Cryptomeria japonica]|nr:hypothetical protein SUGI_0080500 [Cryptomeria japonica]